MFSNSYETILVQQKKCVLEITLNRPNIHNAFNETMITELQGVLDQVRTNVGIRVLVITGSGKSFCAGADMNWMKRMKGYTLEENRKDSNALSQMFETLYTLPIPTIAKVNGAAMGGGVGLVATCDIAVCSVRPNRYQCLRK